MDIYHGQCEHLDCDDIRSSSCQKRYFDLFDPYKTEVYRIIVCNDYLRLKLREKMEMSYHSRLNQVLYEIFNVYLTKEIQYFWHGPNKANNPLMSYCVCNRPYVTSYITLHESVRIITTWEHSYYSVYHQMFRERVIDLVKSTAEYFMKFQKYRYQEMKIKDILKKLQRYQNCHDSKIYSELFLIFFEIQSKFV